MAEICNQRDFCRTVIEGEGAKKALAKDRDNAENVEKEKKKERRDGEKLCPVSSKCGGCQFLDMPYEKQLKKKQRDVEQLLKGFCKVHKIAGMDAPFSHFDTA